MTSLNNASRGRAKTTNRSGHAAYRLDDRTKLVTMALTTMLREPKYYGDTTDDMIQLAESLCERGEGEFVAKLAVWARTEGNLRSVSHALIAVVSYHCSGEGFIRPATRAIASMRGDDGTEILATYKALYGDKVRWPHAIQRGVRDALEVEKPFAVAKYQSKNREYKLRDSLRVTHPNAVREDTTDAMGECVAGTLGMPKGWETELSERGNTKEVWDELIRENRLGTMAKLRNLRNMMMAGADIEPVLETFRSEEAIRKSRLLPFRFHSAYEELRMAGVASTKVTRALDAAMANACANVDRLPGRTAVLIDTSGSMDQAVSRKSVTSCRDIAAVLGAMATHISDDAWVCGFEWDAKVIPMTGTSIMADMAMVSDSGGATNMGAAFDLLIDSGFDADRVIVLSDNECNVEGGRQYAWWSSRYVESGRKTIQSRLERYRRKVGHDVWCHAIDLQGYGTSQFLGPKVQVIAGWNDNVLRFVSMAENGFGTMVDEIEKVEL